MNPRARRHTHWSAAAMTWLVFALVLLPGPRPASAQPSPLAVNDCTLLPDPGALRRCLDQAEGRVVSPPPPVAAPSEPDRPAQSAQSAGRPPAAASVARPQPDFLSDRRDRLHDTRPPARNIIELR